MKAQQPFKIQSIASLSSMTRIKELLLRQLWINFSRGYSLIELNLARNKTLRISVKPEDIAACPVTIADNLQLCISQLLSSLQSVTFLACSLSDGPCMPAVVPQYCPYMYCKLKNISFLFCACFFMHQLCKNYYKPTTGQNYIVDCVTWVPRLTLLDLMNKLDLPVCSRNRTHSYIGDLYINIKGKKHPAYFTC